MKSKNSKNQNTQIENGNNQSVEVLYQKMGDRWFAFSLIEDEVFVGSIPVEKIMQDEKKDASARPSRNRREKISGNS